MRWRRLKPAILLLALFAFQSRGLWAQTTPDAAAPAEPGQVNPAAAQAPATPAVSDSAATSSAPPSTPTVPAAAVPAAAGPATSDANSPAKITLPNEALKTPANVAGPDTAYMLDKNGKLLPVYNVPYEDFIRAMDILRGFGALAAPPYTIQAQKVTGKSLADRAELRVELKLLLHTDQQVRIPLGLNQAVLRSWKYEGAGEQFWNFEDGGDGYVCWLRGEAGKLHTIVMDIALPVVKLGGETALRLGLPPSVTSELTLDVNVPNAIGRVADDDARKLSTRELATGTTQFNLVGVHGDFELAWRPADQPKPEIITELTAVGSLLVKIDGPSIQTDARLIVSSSGGEFEQFSLRLPVGAKLLPSTPGGYEATPRADQTADDIAQHGALVDIKLSQKTAQPIEVRLRTEQSRSGKAIQKGVDFAGFAVVGAARQWGYLSVEVVGDWQVQWLKQQNVRRIEQAPEAPVAGDPIASFEYFGQPFVLTAQISPRTTRVRVEPEYVVGIGPTHITLDGRLKYNIRGASEFALVIAVPGWEDVEVEPTEGIDDKNLLREGDQLTIPLKPARTGPFEVRLKARQPTVDQLAKFSLPAPRATTQSTATLVVLPDDNVELSPRSEEMQGLLAEHVLPRIDLPVRQQEPLVYRGEPGATNFSAMFRVAPQLVEVDTHTHIELGPEQTRLEQKFTYRVEYEPVDHVVLRLPPGMKDLQQPEVTFDGQLLDEASWTIQSPATDDGGQATMRVRLPAPARFGRFEVTLRSFHPAHGLNSPEPVALSLGLFVSETGIAGESTVHISPTTDIRVGSVEKPWVATEIDTLSPWQGVSLKGEGAPDSITLNLELENQATPGATVIDLAWVQSWFTSGDRQDRACYRFTTSETRLDFQLPTGISPHAVQVTLDGFPVAAKAKPSGLLSIELNNAPSLRRRHLELRYRYGQREKRFGRLKLESPQPAGGAWVQTTYWQVILPGDELLLTTPAGFVTEYAPGWKGFWQGRQPLYEQAELEALLGASAGQNAPASTNRYLFRDLGAPARLDLTTARMSWIVFAASLLVMATGFALLYFPALRSPWVAALAVLCLLPITVAYPATAILLSRAAAVGLLLTLFACLLRIFLMPEPSDSSRDEADASRSANLRGSTRSYITELSSEADSSAATTIALHTSEAGE